MNLIDIGLGLWVIFFHFLFQIIGHCKVNVKFFIYFSGNGAEMTIGTEMIGHSIQCSANNGLFSDTEMPISQAVQIDPYSKL